MRIYKIAFDYQEINLEDEDLRDLYGQGEKVFKGSPVRPSNNSEIRDVVTLNGIVIGATSEEWVIHEKEAFFTFDIVIKPEHRSKGAGTQLIKRAIARYEASKLDYQEMGLKTEMKLEAINLPLADAMVKSFGFKVEMRLVDRIFLRKK